MAASAGYVLVMADYGSDGVWGEGGRWIEPGALPISPGLRAALAAWSRRYGGIEAGDEAAWVEAFSAEGLDLARRLKEELPDWDVVYHDEAALLAAPEGTGPGAWQFPVGLGPVPGPVI